MQTKFFVTPRNMGKWFPLVNKLRAMNHRVYTTAKPADISVVLSGKFENPLALSGIRILVFIRGEWQPKNSFATIWQKILQEYYDDMIDLTSTDSNEAIEKIEACLAKWNGKTDQSRTED